MALLDLTINRVTKCSTYKRNPITPQVLLSIYQPLYKLVYQTYPPLKQYSKNQQHTTKIICRNLDTIRNWHINPQTLTIKDIVSAREKSCGLIHRLAKIFLQKSFLNLLDLHFPRNHIYSSIFIRNKIKVSCSCMENIKSLINNHNVKVLNNTTEIQESCNCRNKNNCPLDGKCLTQNILYEA